MLTSGTFSSAMEHEIFEQMFEIPSVSTVKILEEANNRGIPIHTISKENINDVLPEIETSDTVRKDIRESVQQGRVVTIPEEQIQYFDWVGSGYLVMDPETGAAGYMISGGLAGGAMSVAVSGAIILAGIDTVLMIASAVALLLTGTFIGVVAGLGLTILIGWFVGNFIGLMYEYFTLGDHSKGREMVLDAVLGLIGGFASKALVKAIPGLHQQFTNMYDNVKRLLLDTQAMNRLTRDYSGEFVDNVLRKSGLTDINSVDRLTRELADSGISKSLIKKAGIADGHEGLKYLQMLTAKGIDEKQIMDVLDKGIALKNASKLAELNVLPKDFAKLGVIDNIEARALTQAFQKGIGVEDFNKLREFDLRPSHIEAIGIKNADDLDMYYQLWKPRCNCFAADTQIQVKNGTKPIQDIRTGDLVLAKDTETGELSYKPVETTFVTQTEEVFKLAVGKESITTTANHPFWVKDKGWVEAGDLNAGDQIETSDSITVPIEQTSRERAPQTVYNFSVADFHTYYVSEIGVLVHNTSCIRHEIYQEKVLTKLTDTSGLSASYSPSKKLRGSIEESGIIVGENTGEIRNWEAHHIVPAGESYPSAIKARALIKDRIDINAAANGVMLPKAPGRATYSDPSWKRGAFVTTHNGRHREDYYDYVYKKMGEAKKRAEEAGLDETEITEALVQTIDEVRGELLRGEILLQLPTKLDILD